MQPPLGVVAAVDLHADLPAPVLLRAQPRDDVRVASVREEHLSITGKGVSEIRGREGGGGYLLGVLFFQGIR